MAEPHLTQVSRQLPEQELQPQFVQEPHPFQLQPYPPQPYPPQPAVSLRRPLPAEGQFED